MFSWRYPRKRPLTARVVVPVVPVRERNWLAADEHREDILLAGGGNRPVEEVARRAGVTRTVALRVLVPYHIAHGRSNSETAGVLGVAQRTVERHRRAHALAVRHLPV